ncbi:MAG: hypothetical protein ABJF23_11565 [Bryobacteraceae bacterium]
MRAPSALNDELTYLGFARYFSGTAGLPSEPTSAFGAFGYSLIISPAFLISGSFTNSYHAVLILNGILLTACYPLMYQIARRLMGSSPRTATFAGFTCAVYPSVLMFSNYATTENAYVPAFLAYCLVSMWYIRNPAAWRAFVWGACTGTMYMIHSRSFGILAAALALQFLLLYWKRLSVTSFCIFLSSVAGGMALIRMVSLQLLRGTGLGEVSASGTLRSMASAESLFHALIVLTGEIFDLAVSSAGLFVFGSLFIIEKTIAAFRNGADARTQGITMGFLISCVFGVFAISAIFLAAFDPTLSRPDYLANGRYPEGVAVLMIGLGVTWIFDPMFRRTAWRYAGVCLLLIAMSAAVLTPFWKNTEWLAGPGPRIGMLALVGYMRIVHSTAIWPVALAASAFVVIWIMAERVRRAAGVGLVCVAFAASALVEFRMDLLGQQKAFATMAGTRARAYPLLLIDSISRLDAGTRISYDLASWSPVIEAYYQLWCPDKTFIPFDSRIGPPSTLIVIAAKGWKGTQRVEAGCETGVDACLYVPPNAVDLLLSSVRPGLEIAAHSVRGIQLSGLYPIESGDGPSFRWTDGQAGLRFRKTESKRLGVMLRVPMRERIAIDVETGAGRLKVFEGEVQPGIFRQLVPVPASAGPIQGVFIKSDTFEPQPVNGYTRKLGVQIYSLCLLDNEEWCAVAHEP